MNTIKTLIEVDISHFSLLIETNVSPCEIIESIENKAHETIKKRFEDAGIAIPDYCIKVRVQSQFDMLPFYDLLESDIKA